MTIAILIYILLLLSGSLIGYFKAGSLPSLVMGTLSTIFLIFFTVLHYRKLKSGTTGLFLVILVLDTFFIWRWIQTSLFFPTGLFTILSSILLIIILLRITSARIK